MDLIIWLTLLVIIVMLCIIACILDYIYKEIKGRDTSKLARKEAPKPIPPAPLRSSKGESSLGKTNRVRKGELK